MTLQQDLTAVENWAINLFATIKHDVQVAEEDVIKVAQFLQAHIGQIGAGVTGILSIVVAAGVGVPAPLIAVAQGITVVSNIVNQAIAAQQQAAASGQGTGNQAIALLATAYQKAKEAQATLAQAQAVAAKGS